MEDNKPIDGAEYISLEDAKRLKLPYFRSPCYTTRWSDIPEAT
jgi:hypothetical protein